MNYRSIPRYDVIIDLADFFNVEVIDLIDTPENALKSCIEKILDGVPASKYKKLYEVSAEFVENIKEIK